MCVDCLLIPSLTYIDHSQVFLNIVLDDAVEEKAGGEKVRIGQVVRLFHTTCTASHTPYSHPPGHPRQLGCHVGSTGTHGRTRPTMSASLLYTHPQPPTVIRLPYPSAITSQPSVALVDIITTRTDTSRALACPREHLTYLSRNYYGLLRERTSQRRLDSMNQNLLSPVIFYIDLALTFWYT